jgi:Domain of unknown function (DUF222)/HNH endonuclease
MREDLVALGERIAEQAVHLDAAMHRLLTDLHEFDAGGGWHHQGFQSCAHWLSWRVGWDLATARDRVRLANRLPELPKVSAKLQSGELSYSKARAIARVATPTTEDSLLHYAEYCPAAQLEKVCGKLRIVEENAKARVEGRPPERHERTVGARSLGGGMVCFKAVLQAEEAALLMNAIQEAARACIDTKDLTRQLHRADGLMAIVQTYCRGDSPDRTPIDLLVMTPVTSLRREAASKVSIEEPLGGSFAEWTADIDVDGGRDSDAGSGGRPAAAGEVAASPSHSGTFAAADDSAESPMREECPVRGQASRSGPGPVSIPGLELLAELPSGDCLGPETARRLACDAGIVQVLVDERRQPLSVGRKTRSIPSAIKRALQVRDRTCRYPGCENRLFLDGHHIRHWADGGETTLSNLVHLCSFHHRRFHEQGYQMSMDDSGHVTFRDPLGHVVVATPPRPKPANLGWPTIRAANERLDLDATTGACQWPGEELNYGYAIDVILGQERRIRREMEQAAAAMAAIDREMSHWPPDAPIE